MASNHLSAVVHVASSIPAFLDSCLVTLGILHSAICARGSSSVMTMTGLQAWHLAVPQAFCLRVTGVKSCL